MVLLKKWRVESTRKYKINAKRISMYLRKGKGNRMINIFFLSDVVLNICVTIGLHLLVSFPNCSKRLTKTDQTFLKM